jgi:hypothetical protein
VLLAVTERIGKKYIIIMQRVIIIKNILIVYFHSVSIRKRRRFAGVPTGNPSESHTPLYERIWGKWVKVSK